MTHLHLWQRLYRPDKHYVAICRHCDAVRMDYPDGTVHNINDLHGDPYYNNRKRYVDGIITTRFT